MCISDIRITVYDGLLIAAQEFVWLFNIKIILLAMKKIAALLLFFLMMKTIGFTQIAVINLLTENRVNPVGMDVTSPRFSWQLQSDKRNVMQTAYEIKVSVAGKSNQSVWSSNKVMGDSSVHVVYKGSALESGKRYSWQVRVWDNNGKESNWSAPAFFQMGLLNKSDWQAKWIEPGFIEDSSRPCPMFRKQFT
jgi:alpha-L-rhamnosidase